MYVWIKWCFRYKRSLPETNKDSSKLVILPKTLFERSLDARDRSVHHDDSIVIRNWENLSRGMVESVPVHQRTGGIENALHSDGNSVSDDRSHLEVSYRTCTRVSRCSLQLLQTSANVREVYFVFLAWNQTSWWAHNGTSCRCRLHASRSVECVQCARLIH